MDELSFKLEQIYGKRSTYLTNIRDLFSNYKNNYFDALYKLEELNSKDSFKLKIESIDSITKNDVNFYFNSLFEAPTTANYLLTIKKIREFLEKNKLKLKVSEETTANEAKIDYERIENIILKETQTFINSFRFPITFEYYLNLKKEEEEINATESRKNENNKREMYGIEYSDLDYIEKLLDLVISKLPVFKTLIDSYSLLSVQQVDFSCQNYIAIKECFVKVKNSKLIKLSIKNIYNTLILNDSGDYDDIFSEKYITFAATLLECAYFLCDYFLMYNEDNNKSRKDLHKNESYLKKYIDKNIQIFIDKLNYEGRFNVIDTYIEIYNKSIEKNEINFDKL